MKDFLNKTQSGQSLVLVTIFIIVIIAMLAIILDGGNGYLKRRQAQNAADAGALAGARIYCEDPENNYGSAITTAGEFVGKNDAGLLPGYPIISNNKVKVGTTIDFDTFFAGIIGQPQMKANAVAEAGCYGACLAEGVLPVVWTCGPPEEGSPHSFVECEDLAITEETLDSYLYNNPPRPISCKAGSNGYICPELTIVKDTLDVDVLLDCADPGVDPIPDDKLDCDLDGDGKIDWISSSNRGWSDLDGNEDNSCEEDIDDSEGSGELINWIKYGYDCSLTNHTWVGDQTGDPTNIYMAVEERRITNPYVILPIFDKPPCEGDPRTEAGCDWHTAPILDKINVFTSSATQTKYYHIIDFAVFFISCVQQKKGDCPGATEFFDTNRKVPGFPDSYRSIEGYFIKGYQPGLSGKCEFNPDSAFTLYLDK